MKAAVFPDHCLLSTSLVHSAHAAHAGVAGGHWGFGFLDVAEDALGGQQHAGDRSGVVGRADGTPLESHTADLGGVDDTALEEVASSSSAGIPLVLLGAGIVAVVVLAVLNLVDDDAAFKTCVASTSSAATALDNHAKRLLDSATDNLDTEFLVLVAHYI